MRILVCGDIHGTFDIAKLKKFFDGREDEFSKEDFLIICGDVGVCGLYKNDEIKTRECLRNLPVSVLFCDGNHENFDALNSFMVEDWHGGKVHVVEEGIIHLMRGQTYTINNKTFFVFGGAYSIDKDDRVEGVTWFPEEMPSEEEYAEAWANLEKVDFHVDYIITHTAPFEIVNEIGFENCDEALHQVQVFQEFADEVEFKDWYFGHFHVDQTYENFHCLMDEIVEITDEEESEE